MNAIKPFAEKYRVKLQGSASKSDRWGVLHGDETVAPGRYGEIADDYGDGMLRMRLTAIPRNNGTMNKAMNGRAEQAKSAGMRLHQKNGYETVWLFNSANNAHCRLAIELIRPRMRRVRILTDAQKAALAARLAAARAKTAAECPSLA